MSVSLGFSDYNCNDIQKKKENPALSASHFPNSLIQLWVCQDELMERERRRGNASVILFIILLSSSLSSHPNLLSESTVHV